MIDTGGERGEREEKIGGRMDRQHGDRGEGKERRMKVTCGMKYTKLYIN